MTGSETGMPANKASPDEVPGSTDGDVVGSLPDLTNVSLADLRNIDRSVLDNALTRILADVRRGNTIISTWPSYAEY